MRRTARPLAALAALALLLAGAAACGDDDDVAVTTTSTFAATTSTTGTTLVEECSAALAEVPDPQPDLPDAVTAMRANILEDALDCDIAELAALALEGAEGFTFSFGEEGSPLGFWQTLEEAGEEPLATLVEVLGMSFGTRTVEGETHYVWPAAFAYDDWDSVPEAAREELLALYSEEDLEAFARFGSYIGWRVGITEQGDWIFFVRGD